MRLNAVAAFTVVFPTFADAALCSRDGTNKKLEGCTYGTEFIVKHDLDFFGDT